MSSVLQDVHSAYEDAVSRLMASGASYRSSIVAEAHREAAAQDEQKVQDEFLNGTLGSGSLLQGAIERANGFAGATAVGEGRQMLWGAKKRQQMVGLCHEKLNVALKLFQVIASRTSGEDADKLFNRVACFRQPYDSLFRLNRSDLVAVAGDLLHHRLGRTPRRRRRRRWPRMRRGWGCRRRASCTRSSRSARPRREPRPPRPSSSFSRTGA